MKKIKLLLILFLSITVTETNAKIIQVASGDLNSNASNGIISGADDGDIIELTTAGGIYNFTYRLSAATKSFTLRAARGLNQKPIINLPSGVFVGSVNNTLPIHVDFEGIEFIGNSATTYFVSAKSASTGNFGVNINNCVFRDFPSTSYIFNYSSLGTDWAINTKYYDDLKITNSEFSGMFSLFSCSSLYASPSKILITNCYFENFVGTVLSTGYYQVPGGVELDHCTFNNCVNTASRQEINIGFKTGVTTPAVIKNSLFAYRPATSTTANVFGTAVTGSPNTNNAVYYTNGTISTVYPSSLNYSVTTEPVIVNKVATGADYLSAATDGMVIGYKGIQETPPVLIQDIIDNDVDHNIEISFTSDLQWESVISSVKINNSTLIAGTDFELSPGMLLLKPSGGNAQLRKSGEKYIEILANNYEEATITQMLYSGAPSKLAISTQPSSPETNGSALLVQPVIEVHDQYGNLTSTNASILATTSSTDWILGGNITINATEGVARFLDLTASANLEISNASILFTSPGLFGITSATFVVPVETSPTITVSNLEDNSFSYIYGSTPTIVKTIQFSGMYLTHNIVITPTAGFEISTDNNTFTSGPITIDGIGSVSNTILYIRMVSGMSVGNYLSESITFSSIGATSKVVSLEGTVSETIITIIPTYLRFMDYVIGSGPSTEGFFKVVSLNLANDITLSAPTNFELSLVSGGTFTNLLTIPKDSADVYVYVRLVAGLSVSTYSGEIGLSTPNVSDQNVPVSGKVVAVTPYNELHNLPDTGTDPTKNKRIIRSEYTDWPVNHGDAHVTLWPEDKTAAFSITIDDNHEEEHYLWLDFQQKYSLPYTWFVMTDRIGKPVQWESFQNVFDHGNDVQSHSVHHLDLKLESSRYPGIFDDEYEPSVASINTNLNGGNCTTIGYPYGFGDFDVAKRYFIGGRGVSGNVNWADNINYMTTYATTACDTNYVATLVDTNVKIFNKSHYGDWSVMVFHNIINLLPQVEELLQFTAARKDKIWIDLFANVIKFGQERDSHTLTVTNVTPSNITFNLTDLMVDSIFNYPLTVKVRVNNDWENVSATQNGAQLTTRIVMNNSNKYVLVNAVPDRGEVILINEGTTQTFTSESLPNVRTSVVKHQLRIEGNYKGQVIDIYNSLGQKYRSFTTTDTTTFIDLPLNSIYLIKVGKDVFKIKL